MSIESILAITTSIMGVVGVSSLAGLVAGIRNQAKAEAKRDLVVSEIQREIKYIREILGNGQFHGIRQDIQDMKLHCAEEMAGLKEKVASLEKHEN